MINHILFFHAEWCSQCKLLQKELTNFDYIPIIDIDADTNESLCDKYDIKVLPTLILIDNEGNEVIKHIWFINKFDIINLIKDNNYA